MGFKAPVSQYALQFDGDDYEGLEIVAKGLSVEKFLEVSGLADEIGAKTEEEAMKSLNDLFLTFSRSIVRWNIENGNGKPLATTVPGLKSLDFRFVMLTIRAWLSSMSEVSPSLGKGSS